MKILSGRVSLADFVFAKEVKLGTYSGKGPAPPAAIVAAKAMAQDPRAEPRFSERVPYVVVHGAPGGGVLIQKHSCKTSALENYLFSHFTSELLEDWSTFPSNPFWSISALLFSRGFLGIRIWKVVKDLACPRLLSMQAHGWWIWLWRLMLLWRVEGSCVSMLSTTSPSRSYLPLKEFSIWLVLTLGHGLWA